MRIAPSKPLQLCDSPLHRVVTARHIGLVWQLNLSATQSLKTDSKTVPHKVSGGSPWVTMEKSGFLRRLIFFGQRSDEFGTGQS